MKYLKDSSDQDSILAYVSDVTSLNTSLQVLLKIDQFRPSISGQKKRAQFFRYLAQGWKFLMLLE
jgi:hypothetical protein